MALKISDVLLLMAAGFGVIEYSKPGHGVLGGLLSGSAIGTNPAGGTQPVVGVQPIQTIKPVITPPATCDAKANWRYVAQSVAGQQNPGQWYLVWKGAIVNFYPTQAAAEQAYNALWASEGCV